MKIASTAEDLAFSEQQPSRSEQITEVVYEPCSRIDVISLHSSSLLRSVANLNYHLTSQINHNTKDVCTSEEHGILLSCKIPPKEAKKLFKHKFTCWQITFRRRCHQSKLLCGAEAA